MTSRLFMFGLLTSFSTFLVISNSYSIHKQFFSTCIQLTRSNASMLVLLNFMLFVSIILGRLIKSVFFGPLRALEVENLYDRSWYAVTETCLAMTIFRDDFDVRFMILFALLLFVKIFHWITQDRVDFMDQGPRPTLIFHSRMLSVMLLIFLADLSMLFYAGEYTLLKGPSMMIMFGFEYTLLTSLICATFVKYIIHIIDLRSEASWDDKSMYIFYLELVVDFFKLITYILFFGIVVHFYGIPLHIIRDLYITFRSFINRCKDMMRYRQATANMNERYPTATVEELAATDRTCIICREEMDGALAVAGADNVDPEAPPPVVAQGRPGVVDPNLPKKIPCGHIFHFHCLKSWLERQQSCPTCRRSVLEVPVPPVVETPVPPPVQPNQQPQPQPGQQQQQPLVPPVVQQPGVAPIQPRQMQQPFNLQNFANNLNQQHFANNFNQQQQQQQQPATTVPPLAGDTPRIPDQVRSTSFSQLPTTGSSSSVGVPNFMYPVTLTPLFPIVNGANTQAQLLAMEGQSREAIIARLKGIGMIQEQLFGVSTQLTQLLSLMGDEQ